MINATCSRNAYRFDGCSATLPANTSFDGSLNILRVNANFEANTTYRIDIILEDNSHFAFPDTHLVYDEANNKNLSTDGFVASGKTFSNTFTTDQAITSILISNGQCYIGTDTQPTDAHAFDVKVYKLD